MQKKVPTLTSQHLHENYKEIYKKCVFLLQFVLVVPNDITCERIFGLVTTCTAHFL